MKVPIAEKSWHEFLLMCAVGDTSAPEGTSPNGIQVVVLTNNAVRGGKGSPRRQ